MALNTGQLFSGAGAVARGQRRGVTSDIAIDAGEMELAQNRALNPIRLQDAQTLAESNRLTFQTQQQLDPLRVQDAQFKLEQAQALAPITLQQQQATLASQQLTNELNRLRNPIVIANAERQGRTDELRYEQQKLEQEIFAIQNQGVFAAEQLRQQMENQALQQGGLKIPPPPALGASPGQDYVQSLGIPASAAPPRTPPAPSVFGMPIPPPAERPSALGMPLPAPPASAGLTPPASEVQASVGSDTEQLGVALEKARTDYTKALAKLRTYGLAQQNKDPSGYNKARQAVQDAESLRISLQQQYEAKMATKIPGPVVFGAVDRTRADAGAGGTSTAAPPTPTRPVFQTPDGMQNFVRATELVESGGDPTAVGDAGERSSMQVMVDTSMKPGIGGIPNIFDYAQSLGIDVGERNKAEAERLLSISEVGTSFGNMYATALDQKYGGNKALVAASYNWGMGRVDKWLAAGADPAKIPASVRQYVVKVLTNAGEEVPQDLLIGRTPEQTADNIASVTTAERPADVGVMYGTGDVGVTANNPTVQATLRQRQVLANEAEFYYNKGMTGEAMALESQIAAIDLGLYKAQAEQGIYELRSMGDASRAMSVLSQFTGVPTQALARGDGTYDLYQNGRVTQTAMPVEKLADLVKTQVDGNYRQQKSALQTSKFESDLELANKVKLELVKAQGNIELALTQGKLKSVEEAIKRAGGDLTVDTTSGLWVLQVNGRVYAVDPSATTGVRGETVRAPTVTPINVP